MLVRKYLHITIVKNKDFEDQYAFRPPGSTTAAIISLTKTVTDFLDSYKMVRVIALDFSKAFDTVKHHTLFKKLSKLITNTEIYNWLLDFFDNHQQNTHFKGKTSSTTITNSGIIQGSALGPYAFTVLASDLKPQNRNNLFIKYADDTYLVITPETLSSTTSELRNIQLWANNNNLKLNNSKSKEIVFRRPRCKEQLPCIPDVERVNEINILGVTFTSCMRVTTHLSSQIKKSLSNIYAIKILKSRGLEQRTTRTIFKAIVINKLLYAIQSWWGFTNTEERKRIQSFIKRSIRFGYCDPNTSFTNLVAQADDSLFIKLQNPLHVLHHLLPTETTHGRNLRSTLGHNRTRSQLTNNNKRHFITRMIHLN